jgi:hypothetical protein
MRRGWHETTVMPLRIHPDRAASSLRAVEQHPHREVLRDILEPVRDMRGTEQDIAGADCGYRVLDPLTAGARGDEIEFVALMRDLRSIGRTGGEPDLEIAVNEHLGRSSWCPWESERGCERHWGRRAIQDEPS